MSGGLQVATLFDDDGIMVRFMNSSTEGNGIRDAAAASALVQQVCRNPRTGCHNSAASSPFTSPVSASAQLTLTSQLIASLLASISATPAWHGMMCCR